MLIKDVIRMYDENLKAKKVQESQRIGNHATIVDFFTFIIEKDFEISFRDKNKIPAPQLAEESRQFMAKEKQ